MGILMTVWALFGVEFMWYCFELLQVVDTQIITLYPQR